MSKKILVGLVLGLFVLSGCIDTTPENADCNWKPNKDYGTCQTVIGSFFNGEECESISGCISESSEIPFGSMKECEASCVNQEKGIVAICKNDNDCDWVSINCCPEGNGAYWECANAKRTVIDCPDNTGCRTFLSEKPSTICRCLNNQCDIKRYQSVIVRVKDGNFSAYGGERAYYEAMMIEIAEGLGEKDYSNIRYLTGGFVIHDVSENGLETIKNHPLVEETFMDSGAHTMG